MTRMRTFIFSALALTALATTAGAQTFVPLGPYNGEVGRIIGAPSNGSTLLAISGGDGGGLFLSTDTGATWTSIAPDSCGDIHVRDAAFHPTAPSTIYVATMSAGVCRSTNSGQTWTALAAGLPLASGSAFPQQLNAIAINPATPDTLLVGTRNNGIYRSVDGGTTWTAGTGSPNVEVRMIAIAPSSPAVAYAFTQSGVYKTMDSGATWSAATTGLPALNEGAITVDRTNASVAYLVNETLYKTSNGGSSWAAANSGLGSAFFWSPVTVDPANPNTLYVNAIGGTGFARSTNAGASWSAFPSTGLPPVPEFGLTNVYIELFIDPVTPTRFLAATTAGVYRSTDTGATWTAVNTNLATLQVEAPVVIPATGGPGSLIVGARTPGDGGSLFRLPGGALPFTTLDSPFASASAGRASFMAVDPSNPNTIYVLGGKSNNNSTCGQPYKSTNGGSGWTAIANGLPTNICPTSIAIDPTSPSTLYLSVAGATGSTPNGVFKSTNGGSSWSASASGLTGGGVNHVAISPLRANILYAATFSQVFRSANNGSSWTQVSSGLPSSSGSSSRGIRRLAIDPADDNIVYASTPAGVYRTANAGGTWAARTSGWPTLNGTVHSAYALAIDPGAPATIYASPANPANGPNTFTQSAARGVGVYRSTDNGATWTPLTGGISKVFVNDLVFDSNRAIFAATGNGVFKASLGSAPTVTLGRNALAFAATNNGTALTSQTAAQTVRLTVGSGSTVSWTAASDKPWLTVSPASGSGSAALSVAVKFDSSLPASGTVTGSITIALTGAANSVGPIAVTLNVVSSTAAASPPFGSFDTPAGDLTVLAGSVAVTGWTLDNVGVKQVELWRDVQTGETTPPYAGGYAGDPRAGKIFIANAVFTDGARPDVEGLYPTTPANYRAGWGYLMLTWGLFGQGNGTYRLHAFGVDQENNTATIGSKSIIVSNNTATKPFGSIDTPAIGGDASGPNFGWGLTPKVGGVATCKIQASGVQYSIDSGPLQPVNYGDARSDIAGAFPGFSNTAAAGGNAIINWNALTNGAHTIGWLITDDCGRADGVGSRFFNVTTGSNLIAAPADSLVPAQVVAETESTDPITVARGYGELPEIVEPGLAGSRTIEIKQGERIELRTPRGFESAYQLGPGGQRRALPVGSTWDAGSGTFYWQPAAGFLGRFRLVFSNGHERISVRVTIVP